MDAGVFEIIGKGVYQIFGYALSAMTVVVGDDGLILIDPPEDVEKGRRQHEVLRKISDLPIKAVIYSHWHTDHNAGREGVHHARSRPTAVRSRSSRIATSWRTSSRNSISGDGPIIAVRADYSLGSLLEVGAEGRVNGGLGPDFVMETMSLVTPNTLVDDKLEITVAGVRMEIFWAPSEAIDEIVTWFPDLGVLQSAEVIQGESFPNLHSIRGSRYRDPQAWFKSIDHNLRPLPADFMVPSHGRPRLRSRRGREGSRPTTATRSRTSTIRRCDGSTWACSPTTSSRRYSSRRTCPKASGSATSTEASRTRSVRSMSANSAGSTPTRRRSPP